MKAITVYQPMASLIAVGAKPFETRAWRTAHRGPIAIHAGKKIIRPHEDEKLWLGNGFADGAMKALGISAELYALAMYKDPDSVALLNRKLPLGAVVATAVLAGCWEIKNQKILVSNQTGPMVMYTKRETGCFYEFPTEQDRLFGYWRPGRYAWELADVAALAEPVPARGKQGLWEWDEEEKR